MMGKSAVKNDIVQCSKCLETTINWRNHARPWGRRGYKFYGNRVWGGAGPPEQSRGAKWMTTNSMMTS